MLYLSLEHVLLILRGPLSVQSALLALAKMQSASISLWRDTKEKSGAHYLLKRDCCLLYKPNKRKGADVLTISCKCCIAMRACILDHVFVREHVSSLPLSNNHSAISRCVRQHSDTNTERTKFYEQVVYQLAISYGSLPDIGGSGWR